MRKLKRIKLQHRIIVFIVILIFIIVIQTSALFYHTLSSTIENQIATRALNVSKTVASMKEIREAFQTEEPWRKVQPIAERVRVETGAEYVVIGDKHGIRLAHPRMERIGEKMVGGDNDRALIYGQSYVSKATGTLGPALRGKSPILDNNGEIIGIVSVGFLMEDIEDVISHYDNPIVWIALSGLVIGVLGSIYLAYSIKKLIFGLEPEEIASLYKEHHAVIQSVREGIIVVNKTGTIILANQAANNILSLPDEVSIIGKPLLEIIPNSPMLEVLETGQEQLDKQMDLKGKTVIVNRLPVIIGNEVIGVVSSIRLKSEIDQLTEELSQVKRYTDALRSQTHEFNNLLYTISGLIQLESYEEALELIHKETSDHQEMIQFVMNKIKDPWLGGILIGFFNRAKELKINFTLDQESRLDQLPKHIENSHLVSILGNLITNAFEAVEKNDEENKKVRLFVMNMGSELIIEVEDSGSGVNDQLASQIFVKGFSTKKGLKRGNGLAFVKDLVEEMGGSIAFENGDLNGVVFIVAIPIVRGEIG